MELVGWQVLGAVVRLAETLVLALPQATLATLSNNTYELLKESIADDTTFIFNEVPYALTSKVTNGRVI